ncbi:hypothetical protein ABB29_12035 [Pseudoxanthomonas dokdonensis]|uniref:Uncharacterized protein n=1 Tax=Pseudoxanthomonas dokdonensis TaxID=344882 RepID=A0A0R0CIH2_9GAMM|nr:hypothetical protein ABB29_12035 [Pseudoxanthomonas dokdonensis]
MKDEAFNAIGTAVAKSTPPIAVVGATIGGALDMTFMVAAATLIYIVTQTGYLLWKWHKEWKSKR